VGSFLAETHASLLLESKEENPRLGGGGLRVSGGVGILLVSDGHSRNGHWYLVLPRQGLITCLVVSSLYLFVGGEDLFRPSCSFLGQ